MSLLAAMSGNRAPAERDLCGSPHKDDLLACAENERREAQANLDRYLAEVRGFLADARAARSSFEAAQRAWVPFVTADCRALYDSSGQGEREIQFAFCRAAHTRARVHDLWARYVRGSVSKLEEPPSPCAR